ncbi:MAG: hypothetical protein MJ229_07735 [bacterium]|nr:hypothetical protein [bacterium]
MKEIVKNTKNDFSKINGAKLGGLVCNKNAPVIKSAKLGGLVCNKNAPSIR